MSIDEQFHQRALDALESISKIPRPKERKRILADIIKTSAQIAGWEVEIPK